MGKWCCSSGVMHRSPKKQIDDRLTTSTNASHSMATAALILLHVYRRRPALAFTLAPISHQAKGTAVRNIHKWTPVAGSTPDTKNTSRLPQNIPGPLRTRSPVLTTVTDANKRSTHRRNCSLSHDSPSPSRHHPQNPTYTCSRPLANQHSLMLTA